MRPADWCVKELFGLFKGLVIGFILGFVGSFGYRLTNLLGYFAFGFVIATIAFFPIAILLIYNMRSADRRFIHTIGVYVSFILCFAGFWAMTFSEFHIGGFGAFSPPPYWDLGWVVFLLGIFLFILAFVSGQRFMQVAKIKTHVATAFLVMVILFTKIGIDSYPPILGINVIDISGPLLGVTVTQGSTRQLTFTFKSIWDQEIAIPIENLKLRLSSVPQTNVFNYTFSANQLVLQPSESGSIVLTLEIAEDAPLGNHHLSFSLGDYTMGLYQRIVYGGLRFEVYVNPKLE